MRDPLPLELLDNIAGYLAASDLIAAAQVVPSWKTLVRTVSEASVACLAPHEALWPVPRISWQLGRRRMVQSIASLLSHVQRCGNPVVCEAVHASVVSTVLPLLPPRMRLLVHLPFSQVTDRGRVIAALARAGTHISRLDLRIDARAALMMKGTAAPCLQDVPRVRTVRISGWDHWLVDALSGMDGVERVALVGLRSIPASSTVFQAMPCLQKVSLEWTVHEREGDTEKFVHKLLSMARDLPARISCIQFLCIWPHVRDATMPYFISKKAELEVFGWQFTSIDYENHAQILFQRSTQ
ncbi:hypothetical protein BC830DRAFT_1157490 [Chytriomyces sp. MP71]|nr:hypothetical protein BC830DRAFT_1157490 [Chytriomyces sp. MP71]